jgi:putative acetyltransferase
MDDVHNEFTLRPIEAGDDQAIAAIIRRVMPEFGASGSGFAIEDPEVDAMGLAYSGARACYVVLERDGTILGGGGIAPLAGGDGDTCELQKMYFLPEARGHGLGERLARTLLDRARAFGYRRCYLETLTGMESAQRLYAKLGFEPLDGPRGATGHHGCDRWYSLTL